MSSEQASQRAFFGVSALLFAACAAGTIVWCASMSATGGMPMPGGWTMSMAWMRMPGQTWPGAAASFLGMWVVMMVAMMLPSLVPMLLRYREAVDGRGETRVGGLTALVAVGYFFVWTVFGMAAFPLGVALAAIEMQQPALARAVPIAVGVVVLIAGSLQFTAWKARHLACCREAPGRGRTLAADAGTAWRHGLRLGLHCSSCCSGLDGDPPGHRGHGSSRDGGRGGSHHRRTSRTGRRARRASHRGRRRWGRVVSDRASNGARMTHQPSRRDARLKPSRYVRCQDQRAAAHEHLAPRRSAKVFPPSLADCLRELWRGSPKRLRREGGALRPGKTE